MALEPTAPPVSVVKPVRIEGRRLYLRDLSAADVGERYLAWMRDAEVMQYLEARFRTHSVESLRAFVEAQSRDPDTFFLAIVLRDGDRHVGNLKLGPIDPVHRSGDIGILLGERDCWGAGLATEAIAALSAFAFQRLGVAKLTAGCYDTNVGSIRAFQKAGFAVEGVRRSQYRSGEARVDQVLLGRLASDPYPPG